MLKVCLCFLGIHRKNKERLIKEQIPQISLSSIYFLIEHPCFSGFKPHETVGDYPQEKIGIIWKFQKGGFCMEGSWLNPGFAIMTWNNPKKLEFPPSSPVGLPHTMFSAPDHRCPGDVWWNPAWWVGLEVGEFGRRSAIISCGIGTPCWNRTRKLGVEPVGNLRVPSTKLRGRN